MDVIFARYPYPKQDMVEHLCRNARALNLPYGDRKMTYNSRLAQELGKWAQEKGGLDPFNNAVFQAYFVNGQNLATREVLIQIVEQSGLDRAEAEQVLDNRSFSEAVDHDWEKACAMGIDAVPTFVIGNDKLVGAQEYRSLAKFAERHGVKRHLLN